MRHLSLFFFCIIVVFVATSCTEKKKVLMSGEDTVEVNDFMDFFPALTVSFQINAEEVNTKPNDSLLISKSVFSQFVPDSIIKSFLGKTTIPKFYPVGKFSVNQNETYLLVKSVVGLKNKLLIIFFGAKNEFLGASVFLDPDKNPSTRQISSIDKRFSLIKTILRKNQDGSVSEGKEVYVFDAPTKSLVLIMIDELEEKNVELINPLDTLPKENKYSADYWKDSKNLVSIRDGRKQGMINFFIHIEKDNGSCKGELKGEASFTTNKVAVYRQNGDPCTLELKFSENTVNIKEIEGCGLHHDLKCQFDGQFQKRSSKPKN
jgi:hypothetical protein